jgi:predicted flap endonuclease-1-like 5' DNA nuclease
MNFWVGLLIGLIVGWVIEWVIDWRFWRRADEAAAAPVRSVDLDLQAKLAGLQAEKESLAARLEEALNRGPEMVIQEVVKEVLIERDRLQKIRGIGDVFTRRFNDAGVYSFAQLAALTPERAREIIDPEEWQAIEPSEWIAEARQFAEQAQNSQGKG